MALVQTWYSRVNVPYPDVTTTALVCKSNLWLRKAMLKGEVSTGTAGSSGAPPAGTYWTCAGSSDSATAGMDATDRWTSSFDGTKIVRASSGAHSWIVLQAPTALHSSLYLLIDYLSSSDATAQFWWSLTAFTGGTTSARPTSTTERHWYDGSTASTFETDTAASTTHNAHYSINSDGGFCWFSGRVGSAVIQNSWEVFKLVETKSGDSNAIIHHSDGASGGINYIAGSSSSWGGGSASTSGATMRNYNNTASANNAVSLLGYYCLNSTFTAQMGTINVLDSKWDVLPAYIYNNITSFKGIRGRIEDVHIIGTGAGNYSYDPSSASPERVNVNGMLMPMRAAMTL